MNEDAAKKERDIMNKVEEMISATKLNELLHRKEKKCSARKVVVTILAIGGAVVAIAGIVYAVYRFFAPDDLEDYEEAFEDDFDEDFFDDDEI